MNILHLSILNELLNGSSTTQRELAEKSGCSLGLVNSGIRDLQESGLAEADYRPTEAARALAEKTRPRQAVILAAGAGMRMVPINREVSKGMLEVRGVPLVERMIGQLKEAGVDNITVVTGYLNQQYEYLIDAFGVRIVLNTQYAEKNNLHSLALAADRLANCYIIPCDLYCEETPFRRYELFSWYMLNDTPDLSQCVKINRRREIRPLDNHSHYREMLGICYLTEADAAVVRGRLLSMDRERRFDSCFWEEALWNGSFAREPALVRARLVKEGTVHEINTYEQLRELDSDSAHLRSDAMEQICRVLQADESEIRDITVMKKGMTNRSFLFTCRGKRYIMRIPGEGTELLINREGEAAVYQALSGLDISDRVLFLDPKTGYKLSEYIENARICDVNSRDEIRKTILLTRKLHGMKLEVPHCFDIFGHLEHYEALWDGQPCIYRDYRQVKEKVLSLQPFIREHSNPWVLCHFDAVPENYLLSRENGEERWHLIDWEYAGMQDPLTDMACLCCYLFGDRETANWILDCYFDGACPPLQRALAYCYISACGLMWSNWCEYKRMLGVEFKEYSFQQYRIAKEFYSHAVKEINAL